MKCNKSVKIQPFLKPQFDAKTKVENNWNKMTQNVHESGELKDINKLHIEDYFFFCFSEMACTYYIFMFFGLIVRITRVLSGDAPEAYIEQVEEIQVHNKVGIKYIMHEVNLLFAFSSPEI